MDIFPFNDSFTKIKWRILRKGLRRQRGKKQVMVTSHIQGMMDMVVLNSNKGLIVKAPPMIWILSLIYGCLTLSLKVKMVVEVDLQFSHAKSVTRVI